MIYVSKTLLAGACAAILLSAVGAHAQDAASSGTAGPADPAMMAQTAPEADESDQTAEGAKNFIASMGERGINFLGDESMSLEAKKAEFANLLNDSFDMTTIGRFSVGQYWRSMTPAQQAEYQKLFNQMIVRVYSKRFSDYKGQKFDVRTARKEGNDSIVNSFIIPSGGPEVRVDWRVRNKGGAYKVVDIIVEGVSMAQTQRSDFASVIQRGGGKVDTLLNHLRQQ